MPDEALTLAYESTINALREQDSTLSNLRNRATGLLAAAAVGTSFTTALGLAGAPIALLSRAQQQRYAGRPNSSPVEFGRMRPRHGSTSASDRGAQRVTGRLAGLRARQRATEGN